MNSLELQQEQLLSLLVTTLSEFMSLTCQVGRYIVNGNIEVSQDYRQLSHLLRPVDVKIPPLSVCTIVTNQSKQDQAVGFHTTCSDVREKKLFSATICNVQLIKAYFPVQNICETIQTVNAHGDVTNFLKSASSFSMSSLDSLLLSCLYRGEKRALLSSVPEASLNKGLRERKDESGTH